MNRLLKTVRALSDSIYGVQKIVLLIMVLAMVVVNIAQISGRYLFHFSLPWSEELSVIVFIAIILLSGNIAIRTDSEIRIAFFSFKNPRANAALGLFVDLVSLTAILFFVASSRQLVSHAFKYRQVVSSLQLNYAYVFCLMPVGFGLMGFDKLVKIVEKVLVVAGADLRGGKA